MVTELVFYAYSKSLAYFWITLSIGVQVLKIDFFQIEEEYEVAAVCQMLSPSIHSNCRLL
jgi:hypothetical protein